MAHDNVEKMQIIKHGSVIVSPDGIEVVGFDADNASCREVAIMAAAWAIGELQREMLRNIEEPGGGNICIG